MLVINRASGDFQHAMVTDLPALLPPQACLVFNDSKVRKARLYGHGVSGGAVEVLFTAKGTNPKQWICMVKKSGSRQPGTRILMPEGIELTIIERRDSALLVESSIELNESWFSLHGHVPLPPYIRRQDVLSDAERYQTVYAQKTGSSAAPTAGLHFTNELLARLDTGGFERNFVSLHVGLGTFAPVQTDDIRSHIMHSEQYEISEDCARAVNLAKTQQRKLVAIGTTSLRTLESAWNDQGLQSGSGSTSIFMYPGHEFRSADILFTNFHTPESTLFMLACAFGGTDFMKAAYDYAIREKYRFFSYGDAMLIL